MNHYIYKIVNRTNGKFYIGCRSTKNNIYSDTYFGSGTCIKSAIKKHGKKNFYKVIITQCETSQEKFETEALFVTSELINDPLCYNLQTGGLGGRTQSPETREKWKKAMEGKPSPMKGKKHSTRTRELLSQLNTGNAHTQETKEKISMSTMGQTNGNGAMTGRKHSNETKQKMRDARLKYYAERKKDEH